MTHFRTNNNKRGGGGTNNYSSSSSTATSTQRFSSQHHHHDYSKAPPTILKNQNRVDRANSSGSNRSNVSSSSVGGGYHSTRSTGATNYSSQTPSYRSQNEEEEDYEEEEEDFNHDDNEEDNTFEERKKYSGIPSGSSNQRPSQFQSQHVATSSTSNASSSSSSQYYGSSPTNPQHNLSSGSHVTSPRSSNFSRPPSHSGGGSGSSSYSRNNTSNRYHSTHYNPSSTNLMNVKYHCENISHLKSGLDPITQVLLSKKPLHHIIVLFGADLRVRNYAQQVQETFLAKGINVYTQLACYTKETPTSSEDYEFIKPDHLQELITNSVADYVAVIGDRNMKHRTCQAKKNGKLVEVSVDERAEEILQDWETSSPHSDFPILDSISNMRDISDITTEQVYELIEAFANIRHIKDRVDRLRKSISELRDWKSPKSQKSIQTIMDEKMLSKLTTCNNAAIKLHKDLISALEYIQDLPCNSESSSGISVLDPEDERGVSLNSKHLTVSGEDNSEAQTSGGGDDELIIAISSSLKELLIEKCNEIIPTIEKLGDQMSEIAGSSSLWNAYIKEHREEQEKIKQRKLQQQALKSSSISTTPPTHLHIPTNTSTTSNVNRKRNNSTSSTSSSGSISSSGSSSTNPQNGWSCLECTYVNKASLTRCKMCNNPKPSEPEWIDASSQKKPVVMASSKSKATSTASTKTTLATKKGQTNMSVTVPKTSPATSTSSTVSSGSSSSSSTTQKVVVAASSSSNMSPVIVTPTTATSITPSSNLLSTPTNPSPIPNQSSTAKAWQTSSTPVTASSNLTGLLGSGSSNNTMINQQPQQLPSQFFPNLPFPNGSQPSGGILVGPFGGPFVPAIQYPGSMMVGLGLMPPTNSNSFPPMGLGVPPSSSSSLNQAPPMNNPTYDQEYPSLDQLHSKGGKKSSSHPTTSSSSATISSNASSNTFGSNMPVDLLVGSAFSSSSSRGASPLVMNSPKVKDSRSNFGFPSSPISSQSGDSSSVTSQQFTQLHLFENTNMLNQNTMPSSRGFGWDALLTGGASTTGGSFGNIMPSNSGANGHTQQLISFSGGSYGSSHNQEVATSITDSLLSEERPTSPQQKPSNFPASLLNNTLPSNSSSSSSSSLNFTSLSCFNTTGDSMWTNSALSNSSWGSSAKDFSSSSAYSSTNPAGAFATSGGLGLTSFLPSSSSTGSGSNTLSGSSIGSFSNSTKSAFSPFGESSGMISNSRSTLSSASKNVPSSTYSNTMSSTTTSQPSTRRIPVNQPCVVCGQESLLECTICASLRRKGVQLAPTYFCSTEHQQLAWKDHQQKCHNINPQQSQADTSHLTQTPSPFGIKYY
nr:unnamed protein product [Naegleria fowleri]